MTADWSAEQTTDPVVADERNFYKVERWTRDDLHIETMLWAGNSLDKARTKFSFAVKMRPRGHYTIRQRARVMASWPETDK